MCERRPLSPLPPSSSSPSTHLVLPHRAPLDDARLHRQAVPHLGVRRFVGQQLVVLRGFARAAVVSAARALRGRLGGGGGRGGRHEVLEDVGLLEQELHALLEAGGLWGVVEGGE